MVDNHILSLFDAQLNTWREVYRAERMQSRQTLRDLSPLSLGKVLRPLKATDDLLEEMENA